MRRLRQCDKLLIYGALPQYETDPEGYGGQLKTLRSALTVWRPPICLIAGACKPQGEKRDLMKKGSRHGGMLKDFFSPLSE